MSQQDRRSSAFGPALAITVGHNKTAAEATTPSARKYTIAAIPTRLEMPILASTTGPIARRPGAGRCNNTCPANPDVNV